MRGYSVRKKKQFNALIRLDNYMIRLYVSCHDTHVLRLTDTNCNHSYLLIAGSTFGSGIIKMVNRNYIVLII